MSIEIAQSVFLAFVVIGLLVSPELMPGFANQARCTEHP